MGQAVPDLCANTDNAVIFFLLFILLAQYQHAHPDILPTDPQTWASCCHEYDCMEAARIDIIMAAGDYAIVKVDSFPPFKMLRSHIYPSLNGKLYFCRQDINQAPSEENIYCVFLAHPPMT